MASGVMVVVLLLLMLLLLLLLVVMLFHDQGTPDAELFSERGEFSAQHRVLLGELQDPRLENHVVEAPLLAGPLGGFVVPSAPVPVGVVLLVVRDELPLLAGREQGLACPQVNGRSGDRSHGAEPFSGPGLLGKGLSLSHHHGSCPSA